MLAYVVSLVFIAINIFQATNAVNEEQWGYATTYALLTVFWTGTMVVNVLRIHMENHDGR